MADDIVRIAISRDVALVLHEWLARVVDDDNAHLIAGSLEDDAEAWALSGLFVVLEAAVPEPYEPGFAKALAAARRRIVAANGAWPKEE